MNIEPLREERVFKRLKLEMNQAKYRCNKNKMSHKGTKIKRSDQEQCLLSCMPPTTNSKHISNEYKLSCIIKFDGMTTT